MEFRPIDKASRMRQTLGRRNGRRGSTAIEFALMMMILTPLFFGTVALGVTMGRGFQVLQLTRDVAHMYALGVDFSQTQNQAIATALAQGFDLSSSGNAVLIFSQIVTVYQADCDAASVTNCANLGQPVFSQRIVIGNPSVRASNFGTPPSTYIGANGNIAPSDYYQQPSLVAAGFQSVLAQQRGDVAWMVEGYFTTPDLNFLSPGTTLPGGMYARSIF